MLWPEEYEGFRAEAREVAQSIRELYGSVAGERPDDPVARVEAQRQMMAMLETTSPDGADETFAGVPCRVFGRDAPRGTYLHFHGGAMVLGSPRMNDVDNARIAAELGVAVVSVDYRLAPEHPFPAGSDDCLAVAKALVDADDRPIVVGGESAGAYYAALTLLRIRDELGAVDRVRGANLVFGVYDLSGTPSNQLGSRPSDVPDILEDDTAGWVLENYLPGRTASEARAPDCSPLYADLHGLPPALFSVGAADHLLDDSLFMAARWQAWGNEAELAVYPDCIHGFTGFPTELAKRANERIADFLTASFA
jgi:acetyl esterase/lipase